MVIGRICLPTRIDGIDVTYFHFSPLKAESRTTTQRGGRARKVATFLAARCRDRDVLFVGDRCETETLRRFDRFSLFFQTVSKSVLEVRPFRSIRYV